MSSLASIDTLLDPAAGLGFPDRRRRRRLRLDEIAQLPEQLRESIYERIREQPAEEIDPEGTAWWQYPFEVLDLPRNLIANYIVKPLVERFGGVKVDPSSKSKFLGVQKLYASDVMRAFGWKPQSTGGKVAQFLAGLAGDILTDPTFIAGGAAKAAAGGGGAALRAGSEAARGGLALRAGERIVRPKFAREAAQAVAGIADPTIAAQAVEALPGALGRDARKVFQRTPIRVGLGTENLKFPAPQLLTGLASRALGGPAHLLETGAANLALSPHKALRAAGKGVELAAKPLRLTSQALGKTGDIITRAQQRIPSIGVSAALPRWAEAGLAPIGRLAQGGAHAIRNIAYGVTGAANPGEIVKLMREAPGFRGAERKAISQATHEEALDSERMQHYLQELLPPGAPKVTSAQARNLIPTLGADFGRLARSAIDGDVQGHTKAIEALYRNLDAMRADGRLPAQLDPDQLFQSPYANPLVPRSQRDYSATVKAVQAVANAAAKKPFVGQGQLFPWQTISEVVDVVDPRKFYTNEIGDAIRAAYKPYEKMHEAILADLPSRASYMRSGEGAAYFPRLRVLLGEGASGKLVKGGSQRIEQGIRAGQITTLDDIFRDVNNDLRKRGVQELPLIEAAPTDAGDIARFVVHALYENKIPFIKWSKARTLVPHLTAGEINNLSRKLDLGDVYSLDPVDLLNARGLMHARTMGDVRFLKEAVKRIGVPLDDPRALERGYRALNVSGFEDVLGKHVLRHEDANVIERYMRQMRKPSKLMEAWDKSTSLWKEIVLSVPAYVVGNLFGDTSLAVAGGRYSHAADEAARRFFDVTYKARKAEDMIRAGRVADPAEVARLQKFIDDFDAPITLGTHQTTNRQLYNELRGEEGIFSKGLYQESREAEKIAVYPLTGEWQSVGELTMAARRVWGGKAASALPGDWERTRRAWNVGIKENVLLGGATALPKVAKGALDAFRGVNTMLEDFRRVSSVFHGMMRGEPLGDAVKATHRYLFDYGDLSPLDKNIRRALPFWAWLRNNAALQWYLAVARPGFLKTVAKIDGNLQSALAGEETVPEEYVPQYIKAEGALQVSPLTKEGKATFARMSRFAPIKELGAPLSPYATIMQQLHPALKAPIEAVMNRDAFFKQPVQRYEGERKPWLGTQVPAQVRQYGNVGPLGLVQAATQDSDVFKMLGIRASTVNIHGEIRRFDRETAGKMAAIKADLRNRAERVQEAGGQPLNDPEWNRLADLYEKMYRKREESPLKLLRKLDAPLSKSRKEKMEALWEQYQGAVP